MLDFVTELPSRTVVPQVLSLSLGSLSAYSCDLLISAGVKAGFPEDAVRKFLQEQRQVCMFLSRDQVITCSKRFFYLGRVLVHKSRTPAANHRRPTCLASGTRGLALWALILALAYQPWEAFVCGSCHTDAAARKTCQHSFLALSFRHSCQKKCQKT